MKSLRKNDQERYQSMEELLKDLENFNSSLTGKVSQAAVEAQIPSRTMPQSSRPTPTIALPPSAAPIAKPEHAAALREHCQARAAELPSGAQSCSCLRDFGRHGACCARSRPPLQHLGPAHSCGLGALPQAACAGLTRIRLAGRHGKYRSSGSRATRADRNA